jgi:hypothetical protein
MQTFLPYPCLYSSLRCLDYRRLGKQRLEAKQMINALTGASSGWRNHPATVMWDGYVPALMHYHNLSIALWVERGYRNTMPIFVIDNSQVQLPFWFGDKDFHSAHRAALLFKDYDFYSKYGWAEEPKLDYLWP